MISQIASYDIESTFDESTLDQVAHPWFAVRVRSNQERIASLHLEERGYQGERGRGAECAMGEGEGREAMKAWRISNNNKKSERRARPQELF